VLGVDTLAQTTVPAISDLAQHVKWRVRASSIDILFYLIKKSGKDFMN
jgi:serine/threonine-protein phosphatase 2A regulatory subunit A